MKRTGRKKPIQRQLPEGTVRVSSTRGILDVLRALGHDPDEVLAKAGIDAHLYDDPDNLISYSARAQLMEACSEQADCPHFGLLVGQRGRLSSFGLVGYLAMHSPAVGVALESIVRYLHLHVQGAGAVLEQSGDTGFLGYEILQPIASGFDQVEDGALATTYNILRELCGSDWAPSEVWFTHREPPVKGPFRQFFHSLLRFDRARAGLFFPAKWLKCPVSAADPELRRILQKQVDHLERRFRNDFPAQVRRVLHNALLTRHASAEEVAAIFSIHSRTLHRRLKVHGTTFKVLAEDCRYQIARQMLESSDAPLIRVAEMLDYADTKAFGRAFKRWSGVTPGQWRKSRRVSESSALHH